MAYSVTIAPAALRALRRLDKGIRRRIESAIDGLAVDPRPHGCVKLAGVADGWRLRVGNYRVLYVIEDRQAIVLVVDVGHRREVYRGL